MCQSCCVEVGCHPFLYSEIHVKPLKLCKKYREDLSEQARSTKDKQIRLVGTCRKVPLVLSFISSAYIILWRIGLFTGTAAILNYIDLRSIMGCPGGMSTIRYTRLVFRRAFQGNFSRFLYLVWM